LGNKRSVDIIGYNQVKLINKGFRYIQKLDEKGVNVYSSAYCYLNSWSHVPGFTKLKFWEIGFVSFFKSLIINIKSIIAIGYLSGYKIVINQIGNLRANNLIITWCRKEDFDESGKFYDRYFKIKSQNTINEIWFLISIDNYTPKELEKNLIILYKSELYKKFDFIYFFNTLIKEFIRSKFNFIYFLHNCSYATIFSEIVSDSLINSIKGFKIVKACLPYEAQPLHNNIFNKLQRLNIHTIGYLHSALPPLMTDLIYRSGAPDKLFVHGKGQIEILNKFLGWPNDSLVFCKSLRYRSNLSFNMSGYVFLPYDFFNLNLYIKEVEIYLSNSPNNSLPRLALRNHPHKSNSLKHKRLIQKLETLFITYKDKFDSSNYNRKMSLFLGATAAIVEALELGVEVVHIVTDPVFESHSNLIWENISVERNSDYCFSYKIILPGDYISFGGIEDSVMDLFKH
jgi:hypothetical protein